MASPTVTEDSDFQVDPAVPFQGVVVCCTSIPPEQRTVVAQKVADLGGIHKYDLTPDVTHLVVGDYDTIKYRYVARERSDIKAMDAAWIEAVAELWKKDDDIDFVQLEKEYQLKPFERRGVVPSLDGGRPAPRDSLLICLTGFGDQREELAERITSNGGRYTGDLTRKCTHLVVSRPEGKKYLAAKAWNIHTVTLGWLAMTISRGMILEEAKFDPMLPPQEQGKGAWVIKEPRKPSSAKRSRSLVSNATEDGPRKLRKTASMKLNSQRNNIWGDILGRSAPREYSFTREPQADEAVRAPTPEDASPPLPEPEPEGVFANCYFFVHGFTEQRAAILEQTIFSLNGSICGSLEQVATGPVRRDPSYRFLIVPQTSQPETHPQTHYDDLYVVTEYFIEKCLHNKQFFNPNDHVLGRPFPLFPIAGFSDLTICTAAFTGIELNQVARGIGQLGAKFQEDFRKDASVLVCKELTSIRKEKLKMALKWAVPVVSADWLWECISTGYKVPVDDFVFDKLKNLYPVAKQKREVKVAQKRTEKLPRTRSEPVLPPPKDRAGVDTAVFEHKSPKRKQKQRAGGSRYDSTTSADFATARTHPRESFAEELEAPLAEVASARLNKSPTKQPRPLPRSISDLTGKSIAPKEALPAPVSQPLPAVDPKTLFTKPPPEAKNNPSNDQPKPSTKLTEQAKLQAKAAERQALSSKLTSLITPEDPSAAAAAPRPRRRQILGRAASNASSVASRSALDDAESFRAPEEEEPESAASAPPPATQLEYRDPEAQEVKAALMNRMMGGSGDVKPVPGGRGLDLGVAGRRTLRKR